MTKRLLVKALQGIACVGAWLSLAGIVVSIATMPLTGTVWLDRLTVPMIAIMIVVLVFDVTASLMDVQDEPAEEES